MQILHSVHLLVNNHMKRLVHAIWILAMITVVYVLVGCANVSSTLDNGIGQIPGQRVHVNTTVYRW